MQTAIDMVGMRVALHNAQLTTNSLQLAIDGWAEIGDTLQTNMRLTLNDWPVDTVMPLLPFTLRKDIAQLIQGGSASLDSTAMKIRSNSGTMACMQKNCPRSAFSLITN